MLEWHAVGTPCVLRGAGPGRPNTSIAQRHRQPAPFSLPLLGSNMAAAAVAAVKHPGCGQQNGCLNPCIRSRRHEQYQDGDLSSQAQKDSDRKLGCIASHR